MNSVSKRRTPFFGLLVPPMGILKVSGQVLGMTTEDSPCFVLNS